MKKLISAVLLSLLLVPGLADAKKGPKEKEIRALITKIKHRSEKAHKRVRALSDPLIRYAISPGSSPQQGELVTIYATLNSGFTDSETFLADAKLDGADINLEHPSHGLWLYDAGAFTEMNKQHTLSATLFLQDKAQAQQIRDALQSLEAEIQDLNNQIANATDPDVIAQLTAQRDEKVALKDQLTAALVNLKSPVATESVAFSIAAKDTGTDFPRIENVSPGLVKAAGGTTITISGANFGGNPQVKVGGISTPVTSSDASSIVMDTPWLPTGQTHDIEVRFEEAGVVKNAVRKNAIYATDDVVEVPVPVPTPPVAIAEATNSPVIVGNAAQVTAIHSFSSTGQPFDYEWRLIAKPNGSALPLNPEFAVSLDRDYSFTPDVPGNYVMELRIHTTSSPFWSGNVSLAVVEANAPANRAPTGSAPSILVSKNFSKTSQVTVGDEDFWQQRSLFLTKQSAYGSATLSSTGLVTFQAGATSGSDAIEVTIVDNGTPPLSTVVSIPVTVVDNQAPVLVGPIYAKQKLQGPPHQVRLSMSTAVGGVTDPDGTIQSMWWDFGDGTRERSLDTNSSYIYHNYGATGTYHVTYTATDNLGASTVLTKDITVTDTDIPTAKFRVSDLSGTFPLTVTFDASESSDNDGIVEYRWVWGSGAEERTSNPIITHTFNSPGSYNVRLRTLDATAEGESFVLVTLGATPSLTPTPLIKAVPHEVLLGTAMTFDGTTSFTPAVGDSITNYDWKFSDFLCPGGDCSATGSVVSYTYPLARNYFVNLGITAPGAPTANRGFMEVFNVNAGRAPKTIIRNTAATGPAPLTVNFDCSESYDYDGEISSFIWSSGEGDRTENAPAAFTHTYNTPGPYAALCEATDNDNNTVFNFVNISVTPPTAKKVETPPYDGEREYRRGILTNMCWAPPGDGYSCYELGLMYQEDGDEYTKTKLWEKACGLGYLAACLK